MSTAELVQRAHGDAWEQLGRESVRSGGGCARMPGIRLMASGLPHPQWNSGDVDDPTAVDIDQVTAWYEEKRVPWGVRVPSGAPWPHGRKLFTKRLMGVTTASLRGGPQVDGLTIRAAGAADTDAVVHIDAVAFEESASVERPWIDLLLAAPSVTVALAELHGEPVATAYTVSTDGDAGPSVYLAGVAVLPGARRRGVGGALSARLLGGAAAGSRLAHLHPDTDEAARVYARLGFVEVAGFDVYIDNA